MENKNCSLGFTPLIDPFEINLLPNEKNVFLLDNDSGEWQETTSIGCDVLEESALVELANLIENKNFQNEVNDILKSVMYVNKTSYLNNLRESFLKKFGNVLGDILIIDTFNKFIKHNATKREINDFLITQINYLIQMSSAIAEAYSNKNSEIVLSEMYRLMGGRGIQVRVSPAYTDGVLKFMYCHRFSSAISFILFINSEIYNEGVKVKKCENCGKYFLPQSRSDEKYCNYIFKNGKTCREIGYVESKLKRDDIGLLYRKIYKTQNARKQRNAHQKKIEEKFKKWTDFALSKREECKAGLITMDEMERLISSDDWLN